MGRRKIIVNYISDDRKRISTFEKRRIGLFKKASELSRLCGVNIAVTICSSKSLYQFCDLQKDDFSRAASNQDLKVEENFNNQTFQDYLSKKSQNQKISTESSSNEYRSVCQDQVLLNSDEEEDGAFLRVLQEKKVFDSFIKIKHEDNGKVELLNGDISNYKQCSSVSESTNKTADNNYQSHSYLQSLQSLDGILSSTPNSYTYKNTDGLCENDNVNDSTSFENILTSIKNDPVMFQQSGMKFSQLRSQADFKLPVFSGNLNESRIDLDTPIFESIMNNQLFSTPTDFESYSLTESENPLPKKPKLAYNIMSRD